MNQVERAPLAIIFLDMDGVMIQGKEKGPLWLDIHKQMRALYGERSVSSLEYLTACSYFLKTEAVRNLNILIETIEKVAQVGIVMTSNWRSAGSLEEIRELMLKNHDFAKWIIDKTPPEQDENPLCKCSNRNREQQIDCWLTHNKKKLNVRGWVILGDMPFGINNRFEDQFVPIRIGFFLEDVRKASQIMMRQLQP